MCKYSHALLLLLISFSVPGCMTKNDIFGVKLFEKTSLVDLLTSEKLPVAVPEAKLLPVKSTSSLVQAVMEAPSSARTIAAAGVAGAQVLVTQTQKSSKIDITGATGLNADPWPLSGNSLLPAASASISAQQLLSDNGQTERSILLSQLAAKTALLQVEVAIEASLRALIEASYIKSSSEDTIKIIDHYLDLYNAREELVLSAVAAGVLSKSDELELRSLRNNTLSDRTNAVLAVSKADSFLKSTLKLYYQDAMSELATLDDIEILPKFLLEGSPDKKLLDLKTEQLNLEINIQRNKNKPSSNLRTSLSSPTSRGANTTLYGGVTIGFPVADGGESAAQIESLSKELDVTELDRQVLVQEVDLSEKNWAEFLKYYLLQKVLIKERIEISGQSLEELELRLKAGRSDISRLAREILSKAQAEIELVQLEARYLSERVNAQSSSGQTCRLLSLCDTITASLPKN